ncbi:MAG: leucyl aminopeptidase [Paracoccaceae bacterium]|nr:leucyl aminopeptidase [Paracoccaceae bacterium]
MTDLPELSFLATDLDAINGAEGRVVVFLPESGKLDQMARRVNRLTRGALERFAESEAFSKMKEGEARDLGWPTGMAAKAVQVVRLDRRAQGAAARRAGAAIGRAAGTGDTLLCAGTMRGLNDVLLGALLRAYAFRDHKGDEGDEAPAPPAFRVMTPKVPATEQQAEDVKALAEGIYFTRDLVNEPANVLTTTEFADRLRAMSKLGLKVRVLEEAALEKLGMRALLGVGQGSESPSQVVVMEWKGGPKKEKPIALCGKGVVFDTGGISLKPAQGMESMTMDMGGAGTVAGVMRALALRKAKANVIGLVGLVENMPDGRAQRPGDVVRSMKGDTIEVNNTDAEGRLVLADVMWYAQEKHDPSAMIDLATLTGAVIVALGHHNAGVFGTDEVFVASFLRAAEAEGEGAWHLPLGSDYARQLKSRVADVKNSAGRPAGAVTAAEFLRRFVKEEVPWIHLDIAGVASRSSEAGLAPAGATGWGVLALNRLIADRFED